MPDPLQAEPDTWAIVAEGLSKRYHRAAARMYEPPTPLLSRRTKGGPVWQEDDEEEADDDEELAEELVREADVTWAIRDASLAITAGRAVGIVGPPGAGKTVLLRMLAGALPPTAGLLKVRGQVSPLADVAVPFMAAADSPAKNVAVALLAAHDRKQLAAAHLDEILEFAAIPAELGRHGATRSPRELALSTSLNSGADILLFNDPVVGVGADYRERCFEQLERRRDEGRTILLESADLERVQALCHDVLWLDGGRVAKYGPADEVLRAYTAARVDEAIAAPPALRSFNQHVAFTGISAQNELDAPIEIALELELATVPLEIAAAITLEPDGQGVEAGTRIAQPAPLTYREPGYQRLLLRLDRDGLSAGSYAGHVEFTVTHEGAVSKIGRARALWLQVPRPGAPTEQLRPDWEYLPEWELIPGRA